ncbi:MAG: hypothetical protein IPN72_13505 [Saprospiraceae bacterium]|nr:hypothetical protein [Saprospiraceae bacterium]
MKKTKFYQLIALVIVTILCHLFACKSDSNVPKTEMTALLNRPESIQYGKEWETVQNQYQDCVLKISKTQMTTKQSCNWLKFLPKKLELVESMAIITQQF